MKRGFLLGVAMTAATLGLTGCLTTKTIEVPANAEASCSVVTPPGGGTATGGRR